VLFLGYMPIISSSLRVLDCTQPIDGVPYLRSNLDVPCRVGEHAVGAGVAYAVIVGLGVGFPALLGWMLSTMSPDAIAQPSFQGAWGFLYDGYRTSDGEAQRIARHWQRLRPRAAWQTLSRLQLRHRAPCKAA